MGKYEQDPRYVNCASGRPAYWMTDEYWQDRMAAMRQLIHPENPPRKMSTAFGRMLPDGSISKTEFETYEYCRFINEALHDMREGKTARCYYIHQIAYLLYFEPKRLKTRYCPKEEFWVVWLA